MIISQKEYHRKYYLDNKDRLDRRNAEYNKKNYGTLRQCYWRKQGIELLFNDFLDALADNKFRCPICENRIGLDAHVDHDHDTHIIRGIICERCNHGIGHFKDQASNMKRAIAYLERKGL